MMLGFVLIASHLVALIVLTGLTAFSKFTFDEFLGSAAVITPLFITYTVSIMTWMFANPTAAQAPVSRPAVVVAWLVSVAYVSMILIGMFWKSFGSIGYDNFIKLLGVIEASFDAYMGIITKQLFPVAQPSPAPPPAG